MSTKEKTILDAYEEYGHIGAQKLHKVINDKSISIADVKKVIDKQLAYQLHKKTKGKIASHITAFIPNQTWLCDLLDMSKYSKANRKYKWILLVIDVFTRRAWARPILNKTGPLVLTEFKSVTTAEGYPFKLISDNGSEFTNREFQAFLKTHKTMHETAEPQYHKSLGIVDRLSRTIKERIHRRFTQEDGANWVDSIARIMAQYNKTPHLSLKGLSPDQAVKKENLDFVRALNKSKNVTPIHKFKVGMVVRTRNKKDIFTKGYREIWSPETYKIVSIHGVNATLDNDQTYKLNDLQPVSEPAKRAPTVSQVKVVEKKAKIVRKLKQVGISEEAAEAPVLARTGRQRRPKYLQYNDEGDAVFN